MIQLMNYSQRGRMEEQRCALSPVKTRQTNNMPGGKIETHKTANWGKTLFSGGFLLLTAVLHRYSTQTAHG